MLPCPVEKTKYPPQVAATHKREGVRDHAKVGLDLYLPRETQKAAEALRLTLNSDYKPTSSATMGTLVDRYILETMPERHTTTQSYKSYLNGYIKPKWGAPTDNGRYCAVPRLESL